METQNFVEKFKEAAQSSSNHMIFYFIFNLNLVCADAQLELLHGSFQKQSTSPTPSHEVAWGWT